MKSVSTHTFPSYYFNTIESAKAKAIKHGVEVCTIYLHGQLIGYGLYDKKLLQTKDFTSV